MRQKSINAAEKDTQSKPSAEEYVVVGGMAHIAIHTMNLLHLDPNSIRKLQLKSFPTSVVLELPSEVNKMEAVSVFQGR
jgi:hypothetical protein